MEVQEAGVGTRAQQGTLLFLSVGDASLGERPVVRQRCDFGGAARGPVVLVRGRKR
jgi:hypothetical protein